MALQNIFEEQTPLPAIPYQVTGLKVLCEKTLMRKVTIGNMLEMFLLADMYKAPDLREATKYFHPLPLTWPSLLIFC